MPRARQSRSGADGRRCRDTQRAYAIFALLAIIGCGIGAVYLYSPDNPALDSETLCPRRPSSRGDHRNTDRHDRLDVVPSKS